MPDPDPEAARWVYLLSQPERKFGRNLNGKRPLRIDYYSGRTRGWIYEDMAAGRAANLGFRQRVGTPTQGRRPSRWQETGTGEWIVDDQGEM